MRPSGDGQTGEALIRSLYQNYGAMLLAYAVHLTGDRPAAEDIVQETLIRAWRNPDALVREGASVRGWLQTVARNIVIDRARAKAARPREVAEDPVAASAVERDHAQAVVDSVVVLDALDTLSDQHRQVLVEIYYRGRTVGEAAAALGIPAGTVKSRAHHAMRALRGVFAERDQAREVPTP